MPPRTPPALALALLLLALPLAAAANTYTVLNTNDSGAGSLREAIASANSHAGADSVLFHSSLLGKTIRPLTPLPALSDSATTLDGDIDANGTPDITIDGRNLVAMENGLSITSPASGCTVTGLAIIRCPLHGISISGSNNNVVKACHLGVSRGGGVPLLNGADDIRLYSCSGNLIGGDEGKERNIIAGGNSADASSSGVHLSTCTNTRIQRNYFGLNRAGTAALAGSWCGVWVDGGSGNTIGGGGAKYRNLFGTSSIGVLLRASTHDNLVASNYFGLAANGSTVIPLSFAGVALQYAAHDNTIGGTTAGARNVFAGGTGADGVRFDNPNTQGNRILGNYFGLNAAGTVQRALGVGFICLGSVGANTIGGSAAGARNYFCSSSGAILRLCGAGTVIRNNVFGRRPNGSNATGVGSALEVDGVSATVAGNTFANATVGLRVEDAATPKVRGNTFRNCERAVYLEHAASRANLGNLGNASSADDGGNVFQSTNTWHIYNQCTSIIKAEGNGFGTSVRSQINAKIYDHLDNAAYGRVDFDPLIGGVHPTGDTEAALALTATSAVPLASGAEIAFTLSAPAEVTLEVLNVAGRPVATPVTSRACVAGLQRLTWSGLSAQGLRAPSGMYLVRLTARDVDGAQAVALTRLRLER